jgi:hypothetical protein
MVCRRERARLSTLNKCFKRLNAVVSSARLRLHAPAFPAKHCCMLFSWLEVPLVSSACVQALLQPCS